ncbi:PRAMEF20 isoform 2 [Pan troglodytes]|uniref:PRAMEF20 isoform 1 n=2 Tax=Pan troglodytes TaxID=9598 RepID=A0A6D2WG39_PANTR|nr:PRAME family member 20 [Pan troglodytes]PNI25946.1 PRAMEF20 isoform 1 [Pan troglodytes]PNI25947.1 PRAMEF20 isoform 2 [Pan troglodytes]
MSVRTPPRLLELAGRSLLRDEALAISTLEELPTELFPPLFMEAFSRKRCEALKLMVQAWPFLRLPLGSLMKRPCPETFQAVLDGLDALLTHGVRLRRWKLQVLDLQDVSENFWMVWSEAMARRCLPNAMMNRKPVQDCPRMRGQQPLTVFIDLCLKNRTLDEYFTCLLLWVKQREGLVHLCCKKLKMLGMLLHNIRNILKTVSLDCIQEVEVNCNWTLPVLAEFTPYLGQMRNLQKLVLSDIDSRYISPEQKKEFVTQFTTQFLKLRCLQKLYMNSVSFLEGHLDQLLSCLKTSLNILAISNCVLLESDLKHLSKYPSIGQLKTLDLSGTRLANFSLVPLQVLLEKVAATLEYLDLDDCGIVDSQVNAILPALSRCFELTTFSFRGNPISMATLENLLCHTIRLNNLCLELYPAPRESYDVRGIVCRSRFAQLGAELMGRVRALREPERILFCTDYCPQCGNRSLYDLEVDRCCC